MAAIPKGPFPRLIALGTANPPDTYTQEDLLRLFRCDNPQIARFFTSSHIRKRHLVLPKPDAEGLVPREDGATLLRKHKEWGLRLGKEAIFRCLEQARMTPADVEYFLVVSSTGFLCPGLASYLVTECGMRLSTHRLDVLGMGCNAAVNTLVAASQLARANPGKPALMLCCEICSAAYVFDMTLRTGVVNSLFGDGVAAAMLLCDERLGPEHGPELVDFECLMVPEAREEMRFDFEGGLFSFYLGWEIPYFIGEYIATPVFALLDRNGLKRRDIRHWLVHSGGKKVVDAIKYNIGITEYDVRHTRTILRDFGNLSSASVLFSMQELRREGAAQPGDLGVVIGMGPGVSLETGLLRW